MPVQLLDVNARHFSDRVTERLDLLKDQRPRRRHEKYKSVREPAIVIEHYCGCNEGFSETCGQSHNCVLKKRGPHNIELVRAKGLNCGVNPTVDSGQVDLSFGLISRVILNDKFLI